MLAGRGCVRQHGGARPDVAVDIGESRQVPPDHLDAPGVGMVEEDVDLRRIEDVLRLVPQPCLQEQRVDAAPGELVDDHRRVGAVRMAVVPPVHPGAEPPVGFERVDRRRGRSRRWRCGDGVRRRRGRRSRAARGGEPGRRRRPATGLRDPVGRGNRAGGREGRPGDPGAQHLPESGQADGDDPVHAGRPAGCQDPGVPDQDQADRQEDQTSCSPPASEHPDRPE